MQQSYLKSQRKNSLFLRIILVCSLLFYTTADNILAQTFKQVNITVSQSNIDILEADPFSNDDVFGGFSSDGITFDSIDLHYRGAYYLQYLINNGSKRNWKVKFPKNNRYDNRREWNFNYENFIRQHLAYKVFEKAGVPVVSTENVELSVNNVAQGLYLKYEDPDNKRWLEETFGDNDGDLYKAAFDSPGQTKYFADLTYLGPDDEDYFLHYRKQTNKDDEGEYDYTSIRDFTQWLNQSSDDEFEDEIEERFDVIAFIDYLVVSNFISNWDSYPYRPKNYFLYQLPTNGQWNFIPWDLDGTFQKDGLRNPIGTTGSIYHYFDGIAPYNNTATEPLDRPLLWRIMDISIYRDKYCYEYKQALQSYLAEDQLFATLDSISLTIESNVTGSDLSSVLSDVQATKDFITERTTSVLEELEMCDVEVDPLAVDNFTAKKDIRLFPNPAQDVVNIISSVDLEGVEISITSLWGNEVKKIKSNKIGLGHHEIVLSDIPTGHYFLIVNDNDQSYSLPLQVIQKK